MGRQPFKIMEFRSGRRTIPNPPISKIGNGGLCLDIAMMVQKIAQTNLAGLPAYTPTNQTIKPVMDALAGDLNPVKTIHLCQPGPCLHRCYLLANHIKCFIKAEAMCFGEISCGLDIGNALPAIYNTKFRPF